MQAMPGASTVVFACFVLNSGLVVSLVDSMCVR
uniref:Uncharacterized protein n=1 Tax=Arundo donax TaxID=35708 RepID=A0A0A8YCP3_ARUDO